MDKRMTFDTSMSSVVAFHGLNTAPYSLPSMGVSRVVTDVPAANPYFQKPAETVGMVGGEEQLRSTGVKKWGEAGAGPLPVESDPIDRHYQGPSNLNTAGDINDAPLT